jgi:hypothetical protein
MKDNLQNEITGYEDFPDWELDREFEHAQLCLERATVIDGSHSLARERARRKMLRVATEITRRREDNELLERRLAVTVAERIIAYESLVTAVHELPRATAVGDEEGLRAFGVMLDAAEGYLAVA